MLMTVPIHFPYTTLFRSLLELKTARARHVETQGHRHEQGQGGQREAEGDPLGRFDVGGRGTGGRSSADRKSTRLNSSHVSISYAVFCLKKRIYHKNNFLD